VPRFERGSNHQVLEHLESEKAYEGRDSSHFRDSRVLAEVAKVAQLIEDEGESGAPKGTILELSSPILWQPCRRSVSRSLPPRLDAVARKPAGLRGTVE
jgi:hypothetical protein